MSKKRRFLKPSIVSAITLACILGLVGAWYSTTDLPEWSRKYEPAKASARAAGALFNTEGLVNQWDKSGAMSSAKMIEQMFDDIATVTKSDLRLVRRIGGTDEELKSSFLKTKDYLQVLQDALKRPIVCLPARGGKSAPSSRDWQRADGLSRYLSKWAEIGLNTNDLAMASECWFAMARLNRIERGSGAFPSVFASKPLDHSLAKALTAKGTERPWRDAVQKTLDEYGPDIDVKRALQIHHAIVLEQVAEYLSNPTRLVVRPGTSPSSSRIFEQRDWAVFSLAKLPAFQRATAAHIHELFGKGISRLGDTPPGIDTIVAATEMVDLSTRLGTLSYLAFDHVQLRTGYLGITVASGMARKNTLRQALAMLETGKRNALPLVGEAKD